MCSPICESRIMTDMPYNLAGLAAGLAAGNSPQPPKPAKYRAVFISDVHLGTKGSKAEMLAAFLADASCETMYLVGDIIDGWRLKRSWFWDRHHDAVLRTILRHARHGAQVIYIPGNHDEMLREWLPVGLEIAGV